MTIWTDAAAVLSGAMQAVSDELVVYSRGAATLSGLSGTFGKSEFAAVGGDGYSLEMIIEDFVLDTADLILEGVTIKPAVRDRIVRTLPSGDTVTYEVFQPNSATKPYRLSAQDLRMRIHLKRVGN